MSRWPHECVANFVTGGRAHLEQRVILGAQPRVPQVMEGNHAHSVLLVRVGPIIQQQLVLQVMWL